MPWRKHCILHLQDTEAECNGAEKLGGRRLNPRDAEGTRCRVNNEERRSDEAGHLRVFPFHSDPKIAGKTIKRDK